MQHITTADLDNMATLEHFGGFGYIGARQTMINGPHNDPEGPTKAEAHALVAKADAMALEAANKLGWTPIEMFDKWANLKIGRWYADAWFGCDGNHAEGLTPGN